MCNQYGIENIMAIIYWLHIIHTILDNSHYIPILRISMPYLVVHPRNRKWVLSLLKIGLLTQLKTSSPATGLACVPEAGTKESEARCPWLGSSWGFPT